MITPAEWNGQSLFVHLGRFLKEPHFIIPLDTHCGSGDMTEWSTSGYWAALSAFTRRQLAGSRMNMGNRFSSLTALTIARMKENVLPTANLYAVALINEP